MSLDGGVMENIQVKEKEAIKAVQYDLTKDIKYLSIAEIAIRIENSSLDPTLIDREILQQCGVFYRSRGYTNDDIAELFKVCKRTIERYFADVRLQNSINIGPNYQQELLGEVLSNYQLRYRRLLRLSYSGEMSDYERARVVSLCHQIEMDSMDLLSSLGYLSKERGMKEVEEITVMADRENRKYDPETKKKLQSLTPEQRETIDRRFHELHTLANSKAIRMIMKCAEENEKRIKGNAENKEVSQSTSKKT